MLGKLLDRVTTSAQDTEASLIAVADEFINDRTKSSNYDWRYYLVRYSTMREGNSGIYHGADKRLGYELTMLRKTVQRSWYRDACLYAMWCDSGRPAAVKDPSFYGYSTTPRWMKLTRSGTGLRSVPTGIAIRPPASEATEILQTVCAAAGTVPHDGGGCCPSPRPYGGDLIDSEDRVRMGASLLDDLIAAGL